MYMRAPINFLENHRDVSAAAAANHGALLRVHDTWCIPAVWLDKTCRTRFRGCPTCGS